jgi:hypothetical protein
MNIMEMRQIKRQFKQYSALSPDEAYARGSRAMILSSEQNRARFSGMGFPALFGAGAFALLAFVGIYMAGVLGDRGSAPTYASASLDAALLSEELAGLRIDIQLEEVTYRQSVHNTIASALDEISDDQISHLNQDLLWSELEALDVSDKAGNDIDELLQTVIF